MKISLKIENPEIEIFELIIVGEKNKKNTRRSIEL